MTPWYVWAFDGVGGAAVVAAGIAAYQRHSAKAAIPPFTAGKNLRSTNESAIKANVSGQIHNSAVAVGTHISQSVEVHHHHVESVEDKNWRFTEPTPGQILREIDAALPFDRPHVRGKFAGLTLVWKLLYRDIKAEDSSFSVWVEQFPNSFPIIRFKLTFVPPELKTATCGSQLFIRGTIKTVGDFNMELEDDPEIRFLKRA